MASVDGAVTEPSSITRITGGRLLLRQGATWQLAERDLWIEDNRIHHIALPGEVPPIYRSGAGHLLDVDARGQLVIPGLINAHYHSHDNLVRATGSHAPLELWSLGPTALRENYSPREAYISTLLGCLELLSSGCTAAIDHIKLSPHLAADGLAAVVQAYRDAGLRVVVSPVVSDRPFEHTIPFNQEERRACGGLPGWSTLPAREQLDRVAALVRSEDSGPGGRIRVGVGPSGPQRCSDELLLGAAALAGEHNTILHMHVLETRLQREAGYRLYGKSMVAHLDDLGLLGPRTHLVHMVWAEPDDLRRAAVANAVVVHNPVANAFLGSGFAPVAHMRALGVAVALGTDSACCNDSHSLFETMKWASLVHGLGSPAPERWVGPDQAFGMATQGGAQALGYTGELGELAPGCIADLVFIDERQPALVPLNSVVRQLVHGGIHLPVARVMVDGKLVFDRRPLRFDAESLMQEALELAQRRLSAHPAEPDHAVAQAIRSVYDRVAGASDPRSATRTGTGPAG